MIRATRSILPRQVLLVKTTFIGFRWINFTVSHFFDNLGTIDTFFFGRLRCSPQTSSAWSEQTWMSPARPRACYNIHDHEPTAVSEARRVLDAGLGNTSAAPKSETKACSKGKPPPAADEMASGAASLRLRQP